MKRRGRRRSEEEEGVQTTAGLHTPPHLDSCSQAELGAWLHGRGLENSVWDLWFCFHGDHHKPTRSIFPPPSKREEQQPSTGSAVPPALVPQNVAAGEGGAAGWGGVATN